MLKLFNNNRVKLTSKKTCENHPNICSKPLILYGYQGIKNNYFNPSREEISSYTRTAFKHLYKHQIHKSSTENSNPYPRKIDDIPIPRKIDEIHRNIVSAYFKWGFGIIFGDRKFMFSSLLRN